MLMLVMVAAGCRRDEPMIEGKPLSFWKKEAQQVSLFSFWNSEKDERRRLAFTRLSQHGGPAVSVLVELMRDEDIPVSGDAFNALANLGPRAASAVPALIEMTRSPTRSHRLRAAWVLGTIGPAAEPAVPALTRLLEDPEEQVQTTAARALAVIGGEGDAVLLFVGSSTEPRKRATAMEGFAAGPLDVSDRHDLLEKGLSDADASVRLRAVDLIAPRDRGEAQELAPYLARALTDDDPRVRERAHTVFTQLLQSQRTTPVMLATVLQGGDAEARAEAAWRLGIDVSERSHVETGAVRALLEALNDSVPRVRIYAARALVQLEGEPRERAMRQLQRDMPAAEPILRVRAMKVLWHIAPDVKAAQAAYEAGLRDPNEWNRVETMSAIMEMGRDAERFRSHFEHLRNDSSGIVRERAHNALDVLTRAARTPPPRP